MTKIMRHKGLACASRRAVPLPLREGQGETGAPGAFQTTLAVARARISSPVRSLPEDKANAIVYPRHPEVLGAQQRASKDDGPDRNQDRSSFEARTQQSLRRLRRPASGARTSG